MKASTTSQPFPSAPPAWRIASAGWSEPYGAWSSTRHRSRGTRRALSPEGEHGVALPKKRHETRETSDRRPRQQILLGDSPESQAGPSEVDVAPAGEKGGGGRADVEDAGGLLLRHEAGDPIAGGEDGRPVAGAQRRARERQRAGCGLARVGAGGQDERQEALHPVTVPSGSAGLRRRPPGRAAGPRRSARRAPRA